MRNWSVDTRELKKDKDRFNVWKLEQMINFGSGGEKISNKDLLKYWDRLYLDSDKKRFIQFLLWGKKSLRRNK